MNKRSSSKREEVRSRNRRSEARMRALTIILVGVFALFVAFLLIWPSIRPVGEVTMPDIKTYAQANQNGLGNPNAPVRIDEYSDFQCPACAYFEKNIFSQFVTDYVETGKVYFVSNAFAFIDGRSTTKESQRSAQAAYCAMDQGKFWEYAQVLYANQTGENVGDFTDRRLSAFAEKLGLLMGEFNTCMSTNKYEQRVQQETQAGNTAGVNSTPSFVINGKLLSLQSYDQFYKAIDDALAGK